MTEYTPQADSFRAVRLLRLLRIGSLVLASGRDDVALRIVDRIVSEYEVPIQIAIGREGPVLELRSTYT
jgi:hypothetical protein